MKFSSCKSLIPFFLFILVASFLAVGLNLNPRMVPSPFIGKPAPQFTLPELLGTNETISNHDFKDQVWLLNVWASWCAACRDEHPLLNQLSTQEVAPILGLNYKDNNTEAIAWLNQFGNPYQQVAVDQDGQIGIEYGVYGVPETFVIDKNGDIRHKHIGPLTESDIRSTLLPMIRKLQEEAS